MDRERAKELLPIIQAYIDGKEIEYSMKGINSWIFTSNPTWTDERDYRIKPEPKYRPFKDADECWEEMQKHQPFGWVKTDSVYEQIWHVNKCDDFNATFKYSTFADGTPFGVKLEE